MKRLTVLGRKCLQKQFFFHEMPRSKTLKKLQSTRNKRAGMDGKSENRYTINRSPFVHNLSKEAFGFAPRMFFERREVYCNVYSYEDMQHVAEYITSALTTPIMALYPTVAVECLLEADAYFQYENEHYRERVTIGPWGNNIAIPPEYSVERFEEDMEGFPRNVLADCMGYLKVLL